MKFGWKFVVVVVLLGHQFTSQGKDYIRRYLIPDATAKHLPETIQKNSTRYQNHRLVGMTGEEASRFSQDVHEYNHTCGGFIDVEEEVLAGATLQKLVSGLDPVNQKTTHLISSFKPRELIHGAAVQKALLKVRKSRFIAELKGLVAFPNRSAKTDNGREAAEWILNRFRQIAQDNIELTYSFEKILTGSFYKQPSVLVKIHGRDSKKGAIVMGAHMDTFPRNRPGADDDGSGVAALIETFSAVVRTQQDFERDLYFIAYAAEELGLVGSNKVATQFQNQQIPVEAVLQLDMIGYRPNNDPFDIYFVTDYVDEKLTEFTINLATEYVGIPTNKIGKFRCGYGCSDHASWTRKGFSSATPFETNMRQMNRSIHTSRDTMDRLDMDHAMKYVKLGVSFMVELGS